MSHARAAIVLAAGQGTRMKSALTKVLHKVGGRAMVDWAIAAAGAIGCARVVVVTGAHAPEVGAHVAAQLGPGAIAIQDPPLGTGHAVRAAEAALEGFAGDVVVLCGDAPLVRPQSLEAMFAAREAGADVVVMGFEAADPAAYGRLILGPDGGLERIVEFKDASAEERAVTLCNAGLMLADADLLFALLAQVKNDNSKGEYYLTDVVKIARAAGRSVAVTLGAEQEILGVNSRAELAAAEAAFQARARAAALEAGVTMLDPSSVHFSFDTKIAADVRIEPNVFFGPGVTVQTGANIRAFSHIEGAHIGAGCEIGPFARLRPGADLSAKAKVGNFVEVKNAKVGEGAKIPHLSYVGDAEIGARANLGAGTITCNYDGFEKFRTIIGEDAFVGSDSALVAPVRIGARAYIGSGSVITRDVAEGALAIARGRQVEKAGWADEFRARKLAGKAAKKEQT